MRGSRRISLRLPEPMALHLRMQATLRCTSMRAIIQAAIEQCYPGIGDDAYTETLSARIQQMRQEVTHDE